jgi:hypothetical protein
VNYKETLKTEMEMHPGVYKSEEDFLHNAFFPPLNGFIWIDGELVNLAMNGLQEFKFSDHVISRSGELHPPNYRSAIMRIPVDATLDWVDAAKRAVEFAETLKRSVSSRMWLMMAQFLVENPGSRRGAG